MEPQTLQLIIGQMIILVLSICVHEFGHAYIADRLGDRLARSQGRVTLNPLAHADPIGTLALPLVALISTQGMTTGFGWGRPVQSLPQHYTRRFTMRVGHMFVALAGPMMNIFFGTFLAGIFAVLYATDVITPELISTNIMVELFARAVVLNYGLAIFNLIPAPPLDGGAVLHGLLPARHRHLYDQYAPYGIFVAAAFMLIPQLSGPVIWGPASSMARGVFRLFGVA
jgi:Zn-dependent protease